MADRSVHTATASVVSEADAKEAGYRGPQVCKLVSITYRQLDYWARTGLLRPSIADARGSGTQRRYSYHDVLELKVIKQLLDAGISLQRARRAVECMREGLGEIWPPPISSWSERTPFWPTATARSSICSRADRVSSTSFRCSASSKN